MVRKIIFALLFLFPLLWGGAGGEILAQQDPQYSQYMFNQLVLNPAYAGSREVIATSLLYRKQWTSLEGSPYTGALSIQAPLQKNKAGLGAEIISDKLGPKSVSALLFSYAYRIPVFRGKLSFGLRLGIYNYMFDRAKIDYKDQNDVYNTLNRSSKITGSGDFGLYYYSRTFYWGLGMNHLNRGKIVASTSDSSATQSPHYFMPIGKAFEAGNTVINPTILIKSTPNAPASIDVSINILLKEKLWLGVSLRSGYGTVFFTQYQINEKMKIGYSYDYGSNRIGIAGKGSHEIMIGYDLNIQGTKILMPRYL